MDQKLLNYVDKISQLLGKKFSFGIYDQDDIKQEIYILIDKIKDKYNPSLGNEFSFYYHFCFKRLCTLKRDKNINHGVRTIENKIKLVNAGEIKDDIVQKRDTGITEQLEENEYLCELVDKKIHPSMRLNYLRLLDGAPINYHDRIKLIESIKTIIKVSEGEN